MPLSMQPEPPIEPTLADSISLRQIGTIGYHNYCGGIVAAAPVAVLPSALQAIGPLLTQGMRAGQ